ncbi:sensor histidine kinase [Pseudooctadecabacter jejudonensis]|uniref:Signal transduction histidine-protein kinase/phosphatase MprB n=1 Tax=Pseudooctadecabacter jejudonensis TaxID=1391910 RepID=A0A1Y5T6G7_9RHOB|nr:HAMP domain-containing sensor histidine kinase [Pseudooctadecabacter jejudonensis]SLN56448.1 Sensor-type histidine kinase PrrB [Pseudooctadecabacter jejudonensis]
MRIAAKWRPPLWMVLGGTLAVVLCLPIVGIFFVRYMWPMIGYREAVWVAGFGVLGTTFVLGWMLWRILLRPITALRDRAASVRRGDRAAVAPLDHYGTSDMEGLGQSVLDMGRALQSREAVLRGYADHVTHELKSPLTVVRGAAELLALPDLPDPERARLIARVEAAADRMTALLDAQRTLAQAQEPAAGGVVRLSDVATDVEVEADGDVPLPEAALRLVLDHLVGNARAHGATQVTVGFRDILWVEDNGTGISDGNRTRIFEPFFTTRREAGGTGMGLAIVRRVLDAHGAEIALAPSSEGARFEVRF